MNILIKNARVIDPATGRDQKMDLLVEKEKIAEIRPGIPEGELKKRPGSGEVIDGTGKVLVPGLIDMHCHLREPGYE
jgi:dihydroorotase